MTSGSRHAAPEQGSWSVPGATPADGPAPDGGRGAALRRGRPGLVALTAVVVELVIIAAGCNQSVSKHALRYFGDHQNTFLGRAIGSSLQFGWRVSPSGTDNRNGVHVLYSQLLTIGVLVVVTALLTVVVARGPVTFWRAFFGVWTATIAAAVVGRVVGVLVTKQADPAADRIASAVFDSLSAYTVFAGVVLGLVTALVAALVAVSTRRTVEAPVVAAPPPEPAYVPETPPPFYGTYGARDDRRVDPRPVDPRAENETTALPSLRHDHNGEQSTQQLPAAPDDGGATQALPRAPDRPR